MGEIKSAWEIAMEKVKGLGKLSPEELRRKKEEEFALKGKTLANKYLCGLDLWQLGVELDKYKGEDRDLMRQSTISSMVMEIKLEDHPDQSRTLDALIYLRGEEKVESFTRDLAGLVREYSAVIERVRKDAEGEGRKILQQLGISGSAVAEINPKAQTKGYQALEEVMQPYQERLERLKQTFLESE